MESTSIESQLKLKEAEVSKLQVQAKALKFACGNQKQINHDIKLNTAKESEENEKLRDKIKRLTESLKVERKKKAPAKPESPSVVIDSEHRIAIKITGNTVYITSID